MCDTDARPRAPLLLHGRQMPWLLHHHDRLLTRTNRRYLWRVQHRIMSTYRRQGAVDGGVLIPEKVESCYTSDQSGEQSYMMDIGKRRARSCMLP